VRRAECILNFGAGWKVVVTNMFWPLHPGRALWYILGGLMSPTVDWVALQENVFTLIGSTFFVQLFIFSKSMYLQLIFMYSSGIIFKKRKSVQQLCLRKPTYLCLLMSTYVFFPKNFHRSYLAKVLFISWTQVFIFAITHVQMINKILRIILISSSHCLTFRNRASYT
jgi:hypothetical protein